MEKQNSHVWWKVLLGVALVVIVGVIAVFTTQSELFQGRSIRVKTLDAAAVDVTVSNLVQDQEITDLDSFENVRLIALDIRNNTRKDALLNDIEFLCFDNATNLITDCSNFVNTVGLSASDKFPTGGISDKLVKFSNIDYLIPRGEVRTVYVKANINTNLTSEVFSLKTIIKGIYINDKSGKRVATTMCGGAGVCNGPLISVKIGFTLKELISIEKEAMQLEEPIMEVSEEFIAPEQVEPIREVSEEFIAPEQVEPIREVSEEFITPEQLAPIREVTEEEAAVKEAAPELKLDIVSIPFDDMVASPGDKGVILGGFELSANQQVNMESIIFTCAPGSLGLTDDCADYLNNIYLYPSLDTSLFPSIDGPENVDLNKNLRFTNLAASPQGIIKPGEIVRYYIVADVPTSATPDDSLAIELLYASVIAKDSNSNLIFASQIQNCDGDCQFVDGEIHEVIIEQPTTTQSRSLTFSLNDKNPPSRQMVRGYDGRINRYEFLRFNIETKADGATIDQLNIFADYYCTACDSGDLQNVELWMFNGSSWSVVSGPINIDPGSISSSSIVLEFSDDFVLPQDKVTEMRVTADVSSDAEVGDSYIFIVDIASLSPVRAIYTSDQSTVPPLEILTDPAFFAIIEGNTHTVSGLQGETPLPTP